MRPEVDSRERGPGRQVDGVAARSGRVGLGTLADTAIEHDLVQTRVQVVELEDASLRVQVDEAVPVEIPVDGRHTVLDHGTGSCVLQGNAGTVEALILGIAPAVAVGIEENLTTDVTAQGVLEAEIQTRDNLAAADGCSMLARRHRRGGSLQPVVAYHRPDPVLARGQGGVAVQAGSVRVGLTERADELVNPPQHHVRSFDQRFVGVHDPIAVHILEHLSTDLS